MSEESEGFAELLHRTADLIAPPRGTAVFEGAVSRGRTIRRRRAFGAGAGAVVSAGAAGALAFALLPGSTPGASGPAAAESSPAVAVVTVPASRPAATSVGPAATSGRPTGLGYTLAGELVSLMPEGVLLLPGESAQYPSSGDPYVASTGVWVAYADESVQGHGVTGTVGIAVGRGVWMSSCSEALAGVSGANADCVQSEVNGGTLLEVDFHYSPPSADTFPERQYYWSDPAGYQTYVLDTGSAGQSSESLPLDDAGASALARNPAWAASAAQLPAPVCVGGVLKQATGTDLKCSTDGKVYPGAQG